MSTSSTARQREFDFFEEDVRSTRSVGGQTTSTASAGILQMPRFPNFGYSNSVESATSRLAGRLNAAAINSEELRELLDERQKLLDKELNGTISRRETNRLQYVRWSLDRVDDARYGLDLDRLESIVGQYERFQSDIGQFYDELLRLKKSARRR